MALIRQIDVALGRYYYKLNITLYFNSDGHGRFQVWCDNNDYDDEGVDNTLKEGDPTDDTMTEFDPLFPFQQIPSSEDAKNRKIFEILQKCANDRDAFKDNFISYPPYTPTADDWNLEQKQLDIITNIYKTQLPNLCDKAMGDDKSLMKLFGIGYNKDRPYLSFLADSYLRDKFAFRLLTHGTLDIPDWTRLNTHFNKLKKLSVNGTVNQAFNDAKAAVTSYFKRICPCLTPNEMFTIDDSMDVFCEYLLAMVDFVYTLSKSTKQHCPFQVDNCFIFNSVSNNKEHMVKVPIIKKQKVVNDSDGSDDDDVIESNVIISEEKEDKSRWKYSDRIRDIKEKLAHNNCIYCSNMDEDKAPEPIGNPQLSALSMDKSTVGSVSRILHQFNQFKQNKLNKKYKGTELFEYPRNKRVVVIVDRRQPSLQEKSVKHKYITEEDEIIIFEPPKDCCTIPHNLNKSSVPEWFIESSKTCIIPNLGYNKSMEELEIQRAKQWTAEDFARAETHSESRKVSPPMPWDCPRCTLTNKADNKTCAACAFDEKDNELITSNSGCNSGVIILSFHVTSCDEIKCYMYWKGAFTRFFPEDIATLLPLMFSMDINGNAHFGQSKEAKHLIQMLTPKMRDFPFESFYKNCKLSEQTMTVLRKQKYGSAKLLPEHKSDKEQIKEVISDINEQKYMYSGISGIDNELVSEVPTPKLISKVSSAPNEENKDENRETALPLTMSKSANEIQSGPLNDLISWLGFQNSSSDYALHWNVFEEQLLGNFDANDEGIVETLMDDLEDEDDCEYIIALKENEATNGNYKQYIATLKSDLNDYKAIMLVKNT